MKPVRVGNYKLWRSKRDFEQINVSTLDGLWQVKISASVGMFSIIRELYASGTEDGALEYLFNNMMYVSVVPNGYFHRAVSMISSLYLYPNLLREGDDGHDAFMDDVRSLISEYLEWRKGMDEYMASHEPDDLEMSGDHTSDVLMSGLKSEFE